MEQDPKRLTIGLVRFSYMHVLTPKAVKEGDEPKYSTAILIDKTDKKTIAAIEKAIKAATQEGEKILSGSKGKMKLPLRDGDDERDGDENYEGVYFLNANSKEKPQIVDRKLKPILDPDEIYSGMYGYASINMYAFNKNGSKGIAVGLNHIMKVKDGEKLAGRISADEAFADVSLDYESDDDVNDLM